MARATNRLKDTQAKAQQERGLYPDGDKLYLQVGPTGTKSWIFRYSFDKKPRHMGLGRYPITSLGEARQRRDECRRVLAVGIDPIESRRGERLQRQRAVATTKSFKDCADAYLDAHSERWSNDKHGQQWRNTLNTYAYPILGSLPVGSIETS